MAIFSCEFLLKFWCIFPFLLKFFWIPFAFLFYSLVCISEKFSWISYEFLLHFLWISYEILMQFSKRFTLWAKGCMKFWQKCMKLLKLHKKLHKNCIRNFVKIQKKLIKFHNKFKKKSKGISWRSGVQEQSIVTPPKKTLYVRPQSKYQNTSKPVFKITPVHTFMQFEMRLNTLVLRMKVTSNLV